MNDFIGIDEIGKHESHHHHHHPHHDEDGQTVETESEIEATKSYTTTLLPTTTYSTESDFNLINLFKAFDSEKQEDIFRVMHDPNHRHPRHRGKLES